jgi:hypothetical protein
MKLLTSVAFGAAALATTLVGSATPAEARVGVYIGGPGYYGYDYRYRGYRYCDDYWYRRRHPYRCGGAYDYDDYYDNDYYYPGFGFYFDDYHHRHYYRRNHWNGNWGHHWGHHHHHW